MTQTLHKRTVLVLLLMTCITLSACSQRMPSPKTAQGAINGYFKGYGGDFEASDFGQYELDEVEVSSMKELQHGMVYVEAYVSLDQGNIVYKVGATLLKKTIRWKVISWENLGKAG